MYKKFDVRKYNSKNKRYFQDGGEVYYEDCDCHNNDLPTYAKGGQVWQKWERATGLPWREARAMGLTDGSYNSNIWLEKLIDTGQVNDYLHARSKQGTKTKPVPKKSSNTKSQKSLTQRAKEAGFDTLGLNTNFNNRNVTGVNFNPMNLPGTKSQPTTTSTTPQKSLSERFGANMPQVGGFDNTFGIGSFGGYDTGATRELASQSGVSGAKGKTVVPTRESLSLTSQPPSQNGRWTQADFANSSVKSIGTNSFRLPVQTQSIFDKILANNDPNVTNIHKAELYSGGNYAILDKKTGMINVYDSNGILTASSRALLGRDVGDGDFIVNERFSGDKEGYSLQDKIGANTTPAGKFTIRKIDPAFKGYTYQKPFFFFRGERGQRLGVGLHTLPNKNRVDYFKSGADCRAGTGCIQGYQGFEDDLYKKGKLKVNNRFYILPEEEGNYIKFNPNTFEAETYIKPETKTRFNRDYRASDNSLLLRGYTNETPEYKSQIPFLQFKESQKRKNDNFYLNILGK